MIRDVRGALRMSQGQLAARAGVSKAHLSRVERGEARASRIYLDHLARVLADAVDELATGTTARADERRRQTQATLDRLLVERAERAAAKAAAS